MSVKTFGVFVALDQEAFPGLEGLVHISELHTERVRNIEGFILPGQVIDVKVLGHSDDGKMRLSRKATLIPDEEQSTLVVEEDGALSAAMAAIAE